MRQSRLLRVARRAECLSACDSSYTLDAILIAGGYSKGDKIMRRQEDRHPSYLFSEQVRADILTFEDSLYLRALDGSYDRTFEVDTIGVFEST